MRPKQIGRSLGFGRAGRRRATAGDSVRGGVALGSPEIVESDAPGLGLACGLAGEGLRGARDPLVGSRKGCIGRGGWPAVTGGLGSPAYRVSAVPAPEVTLRPRYRVQKEG